MEVPKPIKQTITRKEQEIPTNLQPLFRLATLSATYWRNFFNAQNDGKWPDDRSPLKEYNIMYGNVTSETIQQTLDTVLSRKQPVICIVFGTEDNPLAEYMQTKNTEDKNTLIVINVGLQDIRTEDERITDAAGGRYMVAGSIGSEEAP